MGYIEDGWPSFDWEDDEFKNAPLSDLRQAPDRTSEDASVPYNYVEAKQREKIKQRRSENKMRKSFFRWASKLMSWMIGGNFFIFAGYLGSQLWKPESIPPSVMLTWTSATVVEMIGIVAIIARHLFPGRKSTRVSAKKPK